MPGPDPSCGGFRRGPGAPHTLTNMNFTADPRVGAVVSALLVLVGGYMVLNGSGTSAGWGWLLLAVGVLGLVANIGIWLKTRD